MKAYLTKDNELLIKTEGEAEEAALLHWAESNIDRGTLKPYSFLLQLTKITIPIRLNIPDTLIPCQVCHGYHSVFTGCPK